MAVIEVLKWDGSPDEFAYKYPNNELNTKSQLIVSESQEAILVKEGRFYGPFGAGRHVLNTENIPFLTGLVSSLVSGGVSPFTAEVWFIQKAIPLNIKWGTFAPLMIEDPKYHVVVPLRSFGQYGLQITDSCKFLAKVVGQLTAFTTADLAEYFKGIIITQVKDCLGTYLIDRQISVLNTATYLNEISAFLEENISGMIAEYGVTVKSFTVNSISTDENDPVVIRLREALAKKAEMDIVGYTYTQEHSFETLKAAANNQGSGGLINAGLGLSMGLGIGNAMTNPVISMGKHLQTEAAKSCPQCGAVANADAAFCPQCGKSLAAPGTFCCKCGSRIAPGSKFCPQCGAVQEKCCPQCSKSLPNDTKFCPECGTKVQ